MHRAQFARDAGGDHFLKRLLFVANLTFNWVDSGVSEGRVLAGSAYSAGLPEAAVQGLETQSDSINHEGV